MITNQTQYIQSPITTTQYENTVPILTKNQYKATFISNQTANTLPISQTNQFIQYLQTPVETAQ